MPQHRFTKGTPKPPGSGRAKGTPNKLTCEAAAVLAQYGVDPIKGMLSICADPECSLELKAKMYSELAQYVYPKRKSVELTATIDFSDFESRLASARQRIEHEQPGVHVN